jgi:methionyl-tRNA formyltransferase
MMHPGTPLRIAFMGTPVFAAEILRYLCKHKYYICCVITVPDKPAGRGLKLTTSPVKELALEQQLPILQPMNLRETGFIESFKAFKPDIVVVVAFRMLPEIIWQTPAIGTFNLHASLLPQYRGAAPINRAIMNGETQTGLTTFLIDQHIDTGNILLQESLPIGPDETAGELHYRMMLAGAPLVAKTIDLMVAGNSIPIPQSHFLDEQPLLAAPKIFKEETRINWRMPAQQIHNLIRGLSPYPAAVTTLHHPDKGSLDLKIFRCSFLPVNNHNVEPTIITDHRSVLKIAMKDGVLELHEVQLQGKKRLKSDEFLRGFRFDGGWHLGKLPC